MSSYLTLPTDATTFGLSSAVTAAMVTQASDMIDSYLRRPEGLVYVPDAAGAPGWMANLTANLTLTTTASIAAGENVSVPVSPAFYANTTDIVGEVFVLDRTGAHPEVVVVASMQPWDVQQGQIVLENVAYAHNSGATLERGLVIFEEKKMPHKRTMTMLSRNSIVRMIAGQGRYGYPRRSESVAGLYNEVNLLASLSTFGGPAQWVRWDVSQASISPETGEMWVPAGIMLAFYTDVRVRYVAGFTAANLPHPIKQAAANIAAMIAALPNQLATGIVKRMKAGDTEIERFAVATSPGRGASAQNSLIDPNTRALLDPYRARVFM
jgi:hypothetical protein